MSIPTESFLRSKSASNLPEAFSLNYLVRGDDILDPEPSSSLPTTSVLLDPGSPPSSQPSSSSEPPTASSATKPDQLDIMPYPSSATQITDITSPGSSGALTSSNDHDHPDTAAPSSAEPSPSSAREKAADRPQTPPPSPKTQMYDQLAQSLERLLHIPQKDDSQPPAAPTSERPALRQLNVAHIPDSPDPNNGGINAGTNGGTNGGNNGGTPRVVARRRTNSSPPPSTRWTTAGAELLPHPARVSPRRWSEPEGTGSRPGHRRLRSSDELDVLQGQDPVFLTARPGRGRGTHGVSHSRSDTPTPDLHSSLGSPFTEPPSATQSPRRWDPGQVGMSPRKGPVKLQMVKPPPLSLPSPPDVVDHHGTGTRVSPSSQYSPASTGGPDQPTSTGSHKNSGRVRLRSHDGGLVYSAHHRPSSMSGDDVVMEVNQSLNFELVQLRKDHRANTQLIDSLQTKLNALETQNKDLQQQLSKAHPAMVQKMAESSSAPGESSEFAAHRIKALQESLESSENRCKHYEGQLQSLHDQLTESKDQLAKERNISRQLRVHLQNEHERQQEMKRQLELCTNKLTEFAEDRHASEAQLVKLRREHSQKIEDLNKAQKEILDLKDKLQLATSGNDITAGSMSKARDTGPGTQRGETTGLEELRKQLQEMREQMSEMNSRNLYLTHTLCYDRGYPSGPATRPGSAMSDTNNPFTHPSAHAWAHRTPWGTGPFSTSGRLGVSDSFPPAGRADVSYTDMMGFATPRRPEWGPLYHGPHGPYYHGDGPMYDHMSERGGWGSRGGQLSHSGGSDSLRASAESGYGHSQRSYAAGGNGPLCGPHSGAQRGYYGQYPHGPPHAGAWGGDVGTSPRDPPQAHDYHMQHTGEYNTSASGTQSWMGNTPNGPHADAAANSYMAQQTGGKTPRYNTQGPSLSPDSALHSSSKPSMTELPTSYPPTPNLVPPHSTHSPVDASITSPDSSRQTTSSPNLGTPNFNPYAHPMDAPAFSPSSKVTTTGGRSGSRDLQSSTTRTAQNLQSSIASSAAMQDAMPQSPAQGSMGNTQQRTTQNTQGPFHQAAGVRFVPPIAGTPFSQFNSSVVEQGGVSGHGMGVSSPAGTGQLPASSGHSLAVARMLQLPHQGSASSAHLEPGSSGSAEKRNGSWDWEMLARTSQNSTSSPGDGAGGPAALHGYGAAGTGLSGPSSVVRSKESLYGDVYPSHRDASSVALRQSRPMTSPPAMASPRHYNPQVTGIDTSMSHQPDTMNPNTSPRSSVVGYRHHEGAASASNKDTSGPSFSSPFGKDLNVQEWLAHSTMLEDNLKQLNAEKQQLEAEYARLPPTGRTLAERQRKAQVESKLDVVNAQINHTRLQLRKIGGR